MTFYTFPEHKLMLFFAHFVLQELQSHTSCDI